MKVLIVSRGMPTERYPLNGCFEFEQAVALSAAGIDVTFFGVDLRSIRRKRKYGLSHGTKGLMEWHIINVPIGAVPLSFLCWMGSHALCYLYNKVFNESSKSPDVIHAHFADVGCMAVKLSKKYNIPLVITEHMSTMNQADIPTSLLNCAQKGYSHASRVVAVGNQLKESIFCHTGIKATVIPNMINLEVYNKAQKRNHEGFHIVTTGNLIPRKRFANLIKAISEIAVIYNDIYLDIIGSGYLREELESLTRKLDINSHIHFWGYRNATEMSKIYENCDCFALVSCLETFGVVYVEAMAAGLPVIATRCGGPEDFVNEKNGILIDVDNHRQLCEAIENMITNKYNFSSEEIKKYTDQFSPRNIANRIIGVYNEVAI